eukprot:TRINITY_DN7208_c0_g1_i2.p1 TRINITY_DN7208_c0_g1~~TRINITY_DN7208_c0_g1_i2.p1  ORF type:complete len:318 (-),score=66.28 TRINITY_DN7208_c0_g1_i2:416-1369(-)
MFPSVNSHYNNQYKVGYQGLSFINDTEYKHQYLKYPTRVYAVQGEGFDLRDGRDADMDKYMQKRISLNSPQFKVPLIDHKSDKEYDYFTPKKDSMFKYKGNALSGYRHAEILDSQQEKACKKKDKLKEFSFNKKKTKELSKYTAEKAAYIRKDMYSQTPLNGDVPKAKTIEKQDASTSPREDVACEFPDNEDSRAAARHLEKNLRARKYKQYLDLQMRLNNEQQEKEKLNKLRLHELYRKRNEEFQNLEKELTIRNQVYKEKLANIYERQIAERNEARSRSLISEGENNFSDLLEINRRRYLQVIPLKIIAHCQGEC